MGSRKYKRHSIFPKTYKTHLKLNQHQNQMSSTLFTSTSTPTPTFSEEVCYFENPVTKRRVIMNSNTHKKLALEGIAVPAYSAIKKSRGGSDIKKNVGKKAKISFCMSPSNMEAFIKDIRRNVITNKVFLKAVAKCQESLLASDANETKTSDDCLSESTSSDGESESDSDCEDLN